MMKIKRKETHFLPAMVLGGLYFLLAIGVVLLSGSVYRGVVKSADGVQARRTALSYLTGQVRRADRAGDIALGSFGGGDALYLYEGEYVTVLYQHDGQLRELYTERGVSIEPESGIAILPLQSLSISVQQGRLDFSATDTFGVSASASVAPRCGVQEGR